MSDLDQSLTDAVALLEGVHKWHNELAMQVATLQALIAKGEARRLGRTSDMVIARLHYTGAQINATVEGRTDTYEARITLNPRGHHCTCPDWIQNGRKVGPCKHVLALGQEWLRNHVQPAHQGLVARLVGILEHTSL